MAEKPKPAPALPPPSPPIPPEPEPVVVAGGTVGSVAILLRVLAAMTTEKMLTIFVAAGFGLILYQTLMTSSLDKANERRMHDDSMERARQHCDEREDKSRKMQIEEAEKLRTWFAAQAEAQRRFESEQREKDRQKWTELVRGKNGGITGP